MKPKQYKPKEIKPAHVVKLLKAIDKEKMLKVARGNNSLPIGKE